LTRRTEYGTLLVKVNNEGEIIDTIADILERLEPGAHATFDTGHPGGSIQVRRTDGGFQVVGITQTDVGFTADEAMAEVGRRRRIRDHALTNRTL
jgi:hypothetical protein